MKRKFEKFVLGVCRCIAIIRVSVLSMLLLISFFAFVSQCCGKDFPALSEFHVDEAISMFLSFKGDEASAGFNERAFRANHAYVVRRNHELKLSGARYLLELNEVFADHVFDDDAEIENPVDAVQHVDGKRFLPQGYIDWRVKKAVGPVKNQGQCDVCYAFSAVAAIESAVAVETGVMVPLSEQQVLDCGSNFGNGVCKGKNATGGTSITAYKYVIAQGGIDSEAQYPYRTYNHENCYYVTPFQTNISGYMRVEPSGSESSLIKAVQNRY